jgi:hypothetical protein
VTVATLTCVTANAIFLTNCRGLCSHVCLITSLGMSAVQDITIQTELSEIDAFLNAEALQAKELDLEPDTAVEACMLYALH